MTYEFKSQATSTVTMNSGIAETVLKSIGREPGPTGVITIEQMPQAIIAVKAIASGEPDAAAVATHTAGFIRLLEESLAAGKDITWGV